MSSDYLTHFEELRRRLILALLAFVIAAGISCFFSRSLLDFLTYPLREVSGTSLFFQKPYEAFLANLEAAALSGLIFSSPVLFTQLWYFAAPGLYEKEKRIIAAVTFFSVLLFLAGTAFSFFFVIPWGLKFFLSFQSENLKPLLGISSYFSFLLGMTFAFGLLFDFPVFVIGLVKLGVVEVAALAKARKAVIVLIFILAAILTPSPDPLSQLALALPLILLFETSLFLARRITPS